jgi:hypothetical protein
MPIALLPDIVVDLDKIGWDSKCFGVRNNTSIKFAYHRDEAAYQIDSFIPTEEEKPLRWFVQREAHAGLAKKIRNCLLGIVDALVSEFAEVLQDIARARPRDAPMEEDGGYIPVAMLRLLLKRWKVQPIKCLKNRWPHPQWRNIRYRQFWPETPLSIISRSLFHEINYGQRGKYRSNLSLVCGNQGLHHLLNFRESIVIDLYLADKANISKTFTQALLQGIGPLAKREIVR